MLQFINHYNIYPCNATVCTHTLSLSRTKPLPQSFTKATRSRHRFSTRQDPERLRNYRHFGRGRRGGSGTGASAIWCRSGATCSRAHPPARRDAAGTLFLCCAGPRRGAPAQLSTPEKIQAGEFRPPVVGATCRRPARAQPPKSGSASGGCAKEGPGHCRPASSPRGGAARALFSRPSRAGPAPSRLPEASAVETEAAMLRLRLCGYYTRRGAGWEMGQRFPGWRRG